MPDDKPLFEDDDAFVYEPQGPQEEAPLDAEAEADIAARRVIFWDAVKTWMLSWGRTTSSHPRRSAIDGRPDAGGRRAELGVTHIVRIRHAARRPT